MKKRLLAMLLVLSMVLTCAPGLAMATETGDEPPVLTFEQFKAQATAEGLEALVTLETGEMVMVEGAFEFHVGSATEPVGNVDLSGVTFLIESGEPCRLVIHTTGAVADIEGRTDVEVVVVSYEDEAEEAFVAMIGDEGYETLADAVAVGGEIKLLADIELTEMVTVPENVTATLDLAGHKITVVEAAKHIYALNNKGVLTLKDSVGTGSVTARGIYNGYDGSDTSNTVAGAKLIVESGTYYALDTNGGAAIFNCAELVINGGIFDGQVAALNNRAKGVATVNGGTFRSVSNYAIQNNGGTMTIKNATVDRGFGAVGAFGGTTTIVDGTYLPTGAAGKTCHVVYVDSSAAVNIQGGTYKMNYPEDAVPDSGSAVASYYGGTVNISGGTFSSHFDNVSPVELSTGAVITGGTYLTHSGEASNHSFVTKYIAEGYVLGADGKVVKDMTGVVAAIGDTYYETLAAAIAAGGEIDLLADVTLTEVIVIGKDVVINGNGHTVTSSANRIFRVEKSGQKVTMNDLNMVTTAFQVGVSDIRGISVDPSISNVELTLNNCSVKFAPFEGDDWAYAVNICGTSQGHIITINGGEYNGANAINIWGDNHTVNIDGAKLTSLYVDNEMYHGFCVCLEGTGVNLTVKNTVFNGNNAVAIGENANAANNTIVEENNTDNTKRYEKPYVAKIGDTKYDSLKEAMDAAAAANLENIVIELGADAVYDVAAWAQNGMGGENTKTITINGNGYTLVFNNTNSDWNNVATKNGATLTLNNMTIDNSGHDSDKGTWNAYDINFACDVTMNNVTALNALAFKNGATLNKVKIIDKGLSAAYAIWIRANGQTVSLTDCEIDSTGNVDGRGIKIDNEYLKADETAKVTLTVTNTSFATDSKAAILVKSPEGADITINNVDISKVAADTVNAVWVDDAAAEYVDKVTVTGASMIVEGAVATVGGAYYNTLEAAIAAAEAGETVTLLANIAVPVNSAVVVDKKLILDLNGKTINAKGDAIVVEGDADLTVTGNGTVNACVENAAGGCVAVWAVEGGKITIENGTFSVGAVAGDYNDLIYAKGGTIVINGGYFNSENTYHAEQTRYSVLNINDSYIDSSAIVVNGGSFEDFNPDTGDNSVAGDTFVSEGYMVSCTTNGNGNQVYTVVEKKEAEVDPETNTAFAAGEAVGGVSADVTEIEAEDVADAANNADTAEDLVDAAQNTVTVSEEVKEEAAELIEEIYGEGTVTEETPVVVEIRTYLDVMVEEIDVTEMSMTVGIEALYNTVAVVGNKEVVFGETETMNTEGQPITITLPIPAEFADAPYIYVYHYKKDSENNILATYIYQATVFEENGKYFATFVNPHGFSEFAIVVSDEEIDCIQGHTYDNNVDGTCNVCGAHREDVEDRVMKDMFRMYNPNNGVHFYTGSEEERDHLVSVGWNYEGVAFTFPTNTGAPVYRLYNETTGEHRFTMDEDEKDRLMTEGWNYEGIAFNSAYDTEAAQHCLFNPYAVVGAYHYTFSQQEMQDLLEAGWEYKGIGWYSCFG